MAWPSHGIYVALYGRHRAVVAEHCCATALEHMHCALLRTTLQPRQGTHCILISSIAPSSATICASSVALSPLVNLMPTMLSPISLPPPCPSEYEAVRLLVSLSGLPTVPIHTLRHCLSAHRRKTAVYCRQPCRCVPQYAASAAAAKHRKSEASLSAAVGGCSHATPVDSRSCRWQIGAGQP